MKRALSIALAATMLTTQVWAHRAVASDGTFDRIHDEVEKKIKGSTLSVGTSLLDLNFNLDDILNVGTGLKYEYSLNPESGKFLRQDKWTDYVQARVSLVAIADRRISRYMSYGRYYSDWRTALSNVIFTPLDLKNLNSDTLENRMHAGDMASITFDKATFLGVGSDMTPSTINVGFRAGQVFTGKITTKILRRSDNKVTISFANADETSHALAANIGINIIPGLLKIKLLSIDENFHLRGTADLATYTYDLANPVAKAALDKILDAFDSPSILQDAALLRAGLDLHTDLPDGLLNLVPSEQASLDSNSGITKEQKVTNSIVAGSRSRIKFNLIPGLLGSNSDSLQSINLLDINLSGTFTKPGQYLVGYRSEIDKQSNFGTNSRVQTITSVVYQPDPVLRNRDEGRGYRGLNDLVGISYHTEAKKMTNVKELLTYAKLCNSGLLDCPPIQISVIPEDSPAAARLSPNSNVNSNYFFSKGLFEKVKQRMNWEASSENQRRDSIRASIAPMIKEFVLDEPEKRTASLVKFFYEVLDNNCYSNLVGLEARKQKSFFKNLFNPGKCATELFNISDENIRHNMPALLISLYDPTILPAASTPMLKADPAARAELAKYFAVSINTKYESTDKVERTVNGKAFGLSASDSNSNAAQVMEFTSLIDTWQQQTNNTLTWTDKAKMLKQLQ
jgi:hypothetical protein